MEFVLKHIFEREILPYLEDASELFRRIAHNGGRDYVGIVLQYALERGELKNKQAVFELINTKIDLEVGKNYDFSRAIKGRRYSDRPSTG